MPLDLLQYASVDVPAPVAGRNVAYPNAIGIWVTKGSDGTERQVGYPSFTWAARPSAATYSGFVIKISDVGLNVGGSLFISDGTYWRPVNGSLELLVQTAAVSNTATTSEEVLGSVTIPGGLLVPNTRLAGSFIATVTGSTNAKTIRYRLGGLAGSILTSTVITAGTSISSSANAIMYCRSAASQMLFTAVGSAISMLTVDTTVNQDFVITGQKANAGETLTLEAVIANLS